MAAGESTTEIETANLLVGKVAILYGNVKAVASDGTERVLAVNSPIFAHDRIMTGSDGMVSIVIDDAAQTQIEIGRMSDVVIDEDIFAGISGAEATEAAAEVKQIQELLLAEGDTFDPTTELEAPAAGGVASAGGGHPVPVFDRITHEGEVTSGAETTGITTTNPEPIPGIIDDVNDPPVAGDDSDSTPEDTPVTIDVTGNDHDVDGTIVSWTLESQPGHGSVVNNGDGTFTYTPDQDYNGPDSFTYSVTDDDGATSNAATVTVDIDDVNDPPVAGDATANVSEEGLSNGIKDTDGTPDTTNSNFDSTAMSGQKIQVTDVDNNTHIFTLSDVITDPITGDPLILTSNGQIIDWQVDPGDSKTLVGTAGVGGDPIITITINDSGEYTVQLDGPMYHSATNAEDVLSFKVNVNVSDGTDTSIGTLTVNIEDDRPTIVADYDAIIGNEPGNSLTAPLDISFGADGPNEDNPIQLHAPSLQDENEPNSPYYVVDNDGNFLTSDGVRLVYEDDGAGGLIAVKVNTSSQIFSVALDSVAETYTVTIIGTLDGAAGTNINLNTGGTDPGNDSEIYFYGEDIQVRVTGYDENGNIGEVNSSTPGMGVNNNWINNLVDADSEQLFMVFSNTTTTDPYALTAAAITANSLDIGEEAVWKVYNTINGDPSDPSSWELVNEGTSPGSANANTTFIVEGGINPSTGEPYTFDAIVLEASDGGEYRVLNAMAYTTDSGSSIKITYNSLGVQVFDADNDTNDVHASFDVTFDPDGNINGTDANEAIDGNSLSNMISGGLGDDIISGGLGDDIISGNAGDDIMTGNAGADTFKAGVDHDTITDSSATDGDTIDIKDALGVGDTYAVVEDADGHAVLEIYDGGDTNFVQGSITFSDVNFEDLDTGNELDSLISLVGDIDDGTV